MSTGTEADLVTVIVDDHRAIEGVFVALESGEGNPQGRRDLADHMIAELVRHSIAEEEHMYPAAREHLDGGDEIADHEIKEHTEVERLLKQFEDVDPDDPRFDQLLSEITENVRHHVQEEENDLLPKLRSACSEEKLRDLGEKVLRAKKIAPTRPHPAAPHTPPANLILNPGAGMIDKIRDSLSGRTT